jgi:hypothetical protein
VLLRAVVQAREQGPVDSVAGVVGVAAAAAVVVAAVAVLVVPEAAAIADLGRLGFESKMEGLR